MLIMTGCAQLRPHLFLNVNNNIDTRNFSNWKIAPFIARTMDPKLVVLAVVMFACCAEAVSVQEIPKCVAQVVKAFKGYKMPKSVDTYTQSVRNFLESADDEDDENQPAAPSGPSTKKDCETHLAEFKRRTSRVACHKKFSESELSDEYEDALYNDRLVTDATLGAQLCQSFLKTLT